MLKAPKAVALRKNGPLECVLDQIRNKCGCDHSDCAWWPGGLHDRYGTRARTLKTMSRYGLVDLKREKTQLRPVGFYAVARIRKSVAVTPNRQPWKLAAVT